MFDKHIIANCRQHVTIKNYQNQLILGEDMDNDITRRFGTQCIIVTCFCHSSLYLSYIKSVAI